MRSATERQKDSNMPEVYDSTWLDLATRFHICKPTQDFYAESGQAPSHCQRNAFLHRSLQVLSRVLPGCAFIIAPLDDTIAGKASNEKLDWTEELCQLYAAAQRHLIQHKRITLPRPSDKLWIITDGSVKNTGIGSTLYVYRRDKLHLAGFFSSKLHKHHVKWLLVRSKHWALHHLYATSALTSSSLNINAVC